ncbi:MAG: SRPBCC family protein [Pseudomonadota bacterium]
MPKFTVEKTIQIDATPHHVHGFLRDFRRWPDWSPWLICEPECKVIYAPDGKSYRWEGEVVGKGELELTGEQGHTALDYRLSFFMPWKSVNTTAFRLAERDGGTEVTWTMVGSLPWFMFWMKKMMTAWVGMDYDRGLRMLKDLAETGTVPSKLEFLGTQAHPGGTWVGIASTCAMADIGAAMEVDHGALMKFVEERNLTPSGPPFSIYHKWEPVKGRASYTAAIPVANPPADLASGMTRGEMPACEIYAIRHTGAYRHLGNAWSAGMMHAQAKRYRKHRKIHPFEIYESMPDVDEGSAETLLGFPTK